jgi:4-hydroxy-tetrahydrodipicolinate reductase
MIRVAVFGATGRMGQTLCRLIAEAEDLQLVGAATEPGHASIGQDAGSVAGMPALGVVVTDNAAAGRRAAKRRCLRRGRGGHGYGDHGLVCRTACGT